MRKIKVLINLFIFEFCILHLVMSFLGMRGSYSEVKLINRFPGLDLLIFIDPILLIASFIQAMSFLNFLPLCLILTHIMAQQMRLKMHLIWTFTLNWHFF